MKTVYFTFVFVALIAGALFIETALAMVQSEARNQPEHSISYSLPPSSPQATGIMADSEVGIQATARISIPFGIVPVLPLVEGGEKVLVSGHGGCTADQTVSVVITVTQLTGASAVGQTEEICTGVLQEWSLIATATGANLEEMEAEACGVAVTRSDGEVTDTFEWCRDVALGQPHYLPVIFR